MAKAQGQHPSVDDLVARLRTTRADIGLTLESLDVAGLPVELDQQAQGRLSRMDAINQQQMARAGRARLMLELSRIDAALRRHAEGCFGLCCRCDEPVSAGRLAADPATPFCLECAVATEGGAATG